MLNLLPIVLGNLAHTELYKNLLSGIATNPSISSDGKRLRFDLIGHNSNAYVLDLSTMSYFNFRENSFGDIIDLYLKETKSNISKNEFVNTLYIQMQKKQLIDLSLNYELEYTDDYVFKVPIPYNKEDLEKYPLIISELFLKDNIDLDSQSYWGIRYDRRTKRIIIPVYQDDELVGAIGRRNTVLVQHYENKYMPILPYSKSLVLFGYDEYKEKIQQSKKVMLVESEKSVIKMWQMKSKLPTLALGSHSISRYQIDRLKLLGAEKIIIALDKSLDYDKGLFPNIEKLKRYGNFKEICYLDVNNVSNSHLKEKECICDKSPEDIMYIFKNHLISVNID